MRLQVRSGAEPTHGRYRRKSAREFYFDEGASGSIDSVNDGGLTTDRVREGADDYAVDYVTSSGINNRWTETAGGASSFVEPSYQDMQTNDARSLTYTSAVLEAEIEVTGHPVVHLWISSSAADGDFFVYLEEVESTGRSIYLTEGQLRASHRRLAEAPYDNAGLPWHRSHAEDLEPLTIGEPAEAGLRSPADFGPVSNRKPHPGHHHLR